MRGKIFLLGLIIIISIAYSTTFENQVTTFSDGSTLVNKTYAPNSNRTFHIDIPLSSLVTNITLNMLSHKITAPLLDLNYSIYLSAFAQCGSAQTNFSIDYVNYTRNGINYLYDDFNDGSIDTSKWNTSMVQQGTVTESNGRIHLNTNECAGADSGAILQSIDINFYNDTHNTVVFLMANISTQTQAGDDAYIRFNLYNSSNERDLYEYPSPRTLQINNLEVLFSYTFNSNGTVTLVNVTIGDVLGDLTEGVGEDNVRDVYIEVGNVDNNYEFFNSGGLGDGEELNASLNITSINQILINNCNCDGCSIEGINCRLPFITHSERLGKLTWSINNISYAYGLDNCSTFDAPALNFSIFDENNLTILEADVQGIVSFSPNEIDYSNITIDLNDVSNFSLCIYPNWSIFYTDIYLQYEAAGGIKERYYIDNYTLTNNTALVNIYNFADNTDISELEANLRTHAYAFYPNVIMQMQRYYPDQNAWITVQIDQSDEFGKGIFYVYQNEIDYRFNWILDGVLLDQQSNGASTSPLKFICDSTTECEETFVVGRASVDEQYEDMGSTLSYNNETDIVLLTWTDTGNVVDTVRLVVEQQAANGVLSICDTTITSASGSITCNVSAYNGIITARAIRTASPGDPFAFLRIDKTVRELYNALQTAGWSNEGGFFAFLIMAVVAGFGATSALASVLLGIVGIIFLWVFEITSFINITFVVSGVALGLIVAYMVKK